MRTFVVVVGALFSTVAMAARELDTDFMARIMMDRPECSGDTECTKAVEKLTRDAGRKADAEARQFANDFCKKLGHYRGELKYFAKHETNMLPNGSQIEVIMTGKVYAKCFDD